jgi:hypothetical protein
MTTLYGTDCSICFDEVFPLGTNEARSDVDKLVSKCGHPLHMKCFKGWEDSYKNKTDPLFCPSCREQDWIQRPMKEEIKRAWDRGFNLGADPDIARAVFSLVAGLVAIPIIAAASSVIGTAAAVGAIMQASLSSYHALGLSRPSTFAISLSVAVVCGAPILYSGSIAALAGVTVIAIGSIFSFIGFIFKSRVIEAGGFYASQIGILYTIGSTVGPILLAAITSATNPAFAFIQLNIAAIKLMAPFVAGAFSSGVFVQGVAASTYFRPIRVISGTFLGASFSVGQSVKSIAARILG